MKIISPFVVLLVLATQSCAPLNFNIFRRNTTDQPETLILKNADGIVAPDTLVSVRATRDMHKINGRLVSKLNERLRAHPGTNRLQLTVPPHTIVYVTDMVTSLSRFGRNVLVVQHGGQVDSTAFTYPYRRHLKYFNKKRSRAYNWFYRDLLYW